MQVPTAVCNVRSQSAGCPTSPAIDFLVPGLEGHHFVAWGADRGIIDVGFFQVPHALDTTTSVSEPISSSWRHLISLHLGTNGTSEAAVTHLAFGGGPHVLLAAATRTKLAIFSLEPLMDHVFQADTAAGVGSEHELRPWELSPAVHDELYLVGSIDCCNLNIATPSLEPEIVSISWTHQLDGVLVSDTAGGLTMWQLKPIGNHFNSSSGGNIENLSSLNMTDTGLNMNMTTPSSATCASLRCAWNITAPEPQDLLSAGVSVDAPSASASSSGEKNANVWWPENTSSPSSSSSTSGISVRREKLKHSCNILSLEWCPGVLRKDVFSHKHTSTSSAEHKPHEISSNSTLDIATATTAGGGGRNGNLGNDSGTNVTTSNTNSTVPPIEDHPALMTLGTDRSVRLWVEMLVVHHAPIVVHKEQKDIPVPVPTLDSYFAMALVVESPPPPPPPSALNSSNNGAAAAAAAAASGGPASSGFGSSLSVVGGDTSTIKNSSSTGTGDVSSSTISSTMLARWVRGSGSIMGRQRRGATSSEVLWLIIATKVEENEQGEERRNSSWLIKLYAVRGLSAVVVANVPGSVAGVSSLSGGAGGGKKPQAVLWGHHLWSGAGRKCTTGVMDVLPWSFFLSSFSAWMSAEDDFPMVTCFDIAACIARPPQSQKLNAKSIHQGSSYIADILAAGVTYATVLAENPTAPSTLHQRLDALSSWKAYTAGHLGVITAIAVCPSIHIDSISSSSGSSSVANLNSVNNANNNGSAVGGGGGGGGISISSGIAPGGRFLSKLVATLDEYGSVALWDAKNGIVQYLQSYMTSTNSSTFSAIQPKCLEWVVLSTSSTASPVLTTSIAPVVSPSSPPTQVVALVVGSGNRLYALPPLHPSSASSSHLDDQYSKFFRNLDFECIEEVEGTILSLHILKTDNNNSLLLVLHTDTNTLSTATSATNDTSSHPTHATLFDIASTQLPIAPLTVTTTITTGSISNNEVRIALTRLSSAAMPLPSNLLGNKITSVAPLCSPSTTTSSTSTESRSTSTGIVSLLVGTGTGHVHTLVLPITGGLNNVKSTIEEISKPITLSSTSAGGGSSMAVVSLAIDEDRGTAAAVLVNNSTRGGTGQMSNSTSRKSYLALWKVPHQYASLNNSTDSNTTRSITSSSATTTAATAAAVAAPLRIRLDNPGCSVTWLPGLIVPCVVVGDIQGNMTFYAPVRDATEGWKAVAKVETANYDGSFVVGKFGDEEGSLVSSAVRCLYGGNGGPVVAAVGSRVVCASDEVVVDHELQPLSRHLVEVAGPLPQYHPNMLQALLLGGHHDAASAVLRALTTWAPQYLQYQEQQRYYRLYRTASDVIERTGAGTGGDAGGSGSGTLLDAPTPRAAAELEAAGPPPFPAISLDQFLKPGVAGIPGKLLEMVNKTKIAAQQQQQQTVTSKLSDLGIKTATSSSTVPPPSAVDMMASGQLDMSAFMMGGDSGFGGGNTAGGGEEFGAMPAPAAPSAPVVSAPVASVSSAMDTGMLDFAAFGMDIMPPPQHEAVPSPSPAAASIESGALDLSSFGMAFDIPGATSLQPVPSMQPSLSPARPTVSAETKNVAATTAPLLSAPKQASVSISELRPFSSELLASLHQIVGLVASNKDETTALNQEESNEFSNHRDLSFLRGSASRHNTGASSTTTAALDLLRCRPLQPLPGLTIEETQDVVAIATYFSCESLAGASAPLTTPVDVAGAHFLTALNLACSRPFEEPSNMPFTHDYNQNLQNKSPAGGGNAAATAARASQSSLKSLQKTASSASTAALLKRSKSVRNAAGVEYTLAPSMSSMASLSSGAGDEENEDDNESSFAGGTAGGVSDVLARRWGLAPGLQLSAIFWGQLTSSPQALLDHALAKIAARDAEITASLQAEALAQDASATDFLSNLARPGGGSGSGSGLTWPALRAVGAGFWLHDRALLASTAEALAKSRFAANRNPDDAALFYAALGKKSVLQGLYRTTNQTRQADFLGRDFSQVKHQQAACKNAFVLMGNHRPELAAAFFILGASPGDAVSVCVRELGDVQLALFIARVLHGPGSEAERALIERHILPAVLAATAGSGQQEAETSGAVSSFSTSSASSLGGWASAVTAWLLGDSSACLKSILGLSPWPSAGSGELATTMRDVPEGFVQLLPALELATQVTPSPSFSSSELPSIEILKAALQERCATASEALQSAGLPALALQFEAVAAACQQAENSNNALSSTSSGGASSQSQSNQNIRAAWACAAALLSHPSGENPTQAVATEKQLAALRAVGLDIDKFETLKRIHTLQKAINPTTSAASTTGAAGGSLLGSMFSPRAAFGGPSSLLFRQSSFDTTRSTHSMHSSGSGGLRASIDGHMRHNRPATTAASGGAHGSQGQHHQKSLPLSEGSVIFQVDSDSLHGVACCPLISPQVLGRPIITATHRHGLLEFAAQAPAPAPVGSLQRKNSATLDSVPDHHSQHQQNQSSSSHLLVHTEEDISNADFISEGSLPASPHSPSQASGGGNEQSANMFSRFLSQIFDQSSWTLDPMERSHHYTTDGDVGLAVASAMASANSGHISGSPSGGGASSSSPLSSSSERYSFSTSINPQNTRALTVAAHSLRQLFLSGCEASGRVQLWQFGGPRPVASFTPVSPNDLSATQADTGLLSFSFSTRGMSKSTSLVGRLGHWGGARGLAFSPNGERFAAIGDGGVVATWRLGGGSHRPTDLDGALCAEWWHHCLSKQGRAVVYIGGGGSVVAVGGKCSSGNIALWDAASPPSEACVGRLKHHSATVNALCTMPGGWLVAAADAGGALSLTDIRMLGGSTGGARTLWSVRASKGAVQSLVMLPLAATDRPRALAMGAASGGSGVLVSGGQDGIVRVWQASSGKLLQSMEGCSSAYQQKSGGKGLLSLGGMATTGVSGVTGLAVCEEGVVSCGADGTVRLFPLA